MKQYKIALLEKGFPFLKDLEQHVDSEISLENLDDVTVEKCDKNLLNQKGEEDSYSWDFGGHYDYTKYYAAIMYENGNWDLIELKTKGEARSGSGRDDSSWDCDPIDQQLFQKKIDPDFIIQCNRSDTDDNGQGFFQCHWIIYKMKDINLAEHYMKKIDKAASQLKSQIEKTFK
jgi:hypothetical protein